MVATFPEPKEGDVGHIKEHHPEDEQGHQKSFYGIYPVPLSQYSQAGEGKPDEDAPRVSEEDGGRLVGEQVVGEKAEAPPHEAEAQEHEEGLIGLKSDQADEERGDRPKPRRQPVHSVEEVEGVGDADDADEGENDLDRISQETGRKKGKAHTGIYDQGAGEELAGQLQPGGDAPRVVDEAQKKNGRRGEADPQQSRRIKIVDEDRRGEPDENRKAPEQRGGFLVQLSPARQIGDAEAEGDGPHEGGGEEGDQKRHRGDVDPPETVHLQPAPDLGHHDEKQKEKSYPVEVEESVVRNGLLFISVFCRHSTRLISPRCGKRRV